MTRSEYLTLICNVVNRADGTEHLPVTSPVVAMFANGFLPSDPDGEQSGDNMTSLEIVTALEDICQLSTTDVALVMSYLGFRLTVNSYRGVEWSMTAYKA